MTESRIVRGEDLRVGDVILHLGHVYSITRFEPHPHPIVEGSRIAFSGSWSITVNPDDRFEVQR